jgi:hypothetical protein
VNDSSEDGETAEQGFVFANAGSGMLQVKAFGACDASWISSAMTSHMECVGAARYISSIHTASTPFLFLLFMDLSCSTLEVCGGRVVFTKRSREAPQPLESHARFIVHKLDRRGEFCYISGL